MATCIGEAPVQARRLLATILTLTTPAGVLLEQSLFHAGGQSGGLSSTGAEGSAGSASLAAEWAAEPTSGVEEITGEAQYSLSMSSLKHLLCEPRGELPLLTVLRHHLSLLLQPDPGHSAVAPSFFVVSLTKMGTMGRGCSLSDQQIEQNICLDQRVHKTACSLH